MIASLLQTMEDQGNQRVQAHAAAALINFTEDCPKALLVPYLENLVTHLHSIMVLKLQEVSEARRASARTWDAGLNTHCQIDPSRLTSMC